ncbi:hypothetical protein D9758_001832 [Tetrapyrgos nigripes]|uniref:PH domain-containing protein n=1 Tax=Tetrapyrgos nigripes TaxID=182062 RepID=A0A8H5GT39_9AGAR|nr:hypothetical protein D9758_001832 [Tetrapyrgos nigripes]
MAGLDMFSKIPSRLTAQFGLLPDAEKLAFRREPGGLQKLASARNIPETDSYWNQYVVLFDSASEVFSLITPNDIRRALLDAPENVATLIRVICSRLFNLISDHTFPTPTSASVSAFATSFIKAGTSERNTTKEVLNCLRVLQRVLPVVFDVEGESSVFELEVLWKKAEIDDLEEGEGTASATPQFVLEDDEDEDDEEKEQQPASPKPRQKKHLPSLGEKLFNAIIDLMFCCGFTLPTKIQKDHHKINYVIWEKGIGSTMDPGPIHQYDANKTEVLRLLLVLLSRQIYIPASALFAKPSLYTLHLVQKLPRRDVLTVLCSLLNTAMNSSSGPHSSSIGAMAGKLPYNHLVFKGEDPQVNLAATCFEVLVVLLDFQSSSARDVLTGEGELQSSSPTARTNAFRYFLMKLHRTQDFAFILNGVLGIMEQQIMITNNILPGARKSIPYVAENIIFFWKMIELNKKFRSYLLESDKSMELVAYLLCYNLEIKDKPQQHGVCRALSYIIQTLSAEPAFGLKLTGPVKAQLPAKWHTTGTMADFLINAIYSVVATTSGALTLLYPALIIALSNVAPYFKNLSVTSSTRLVQLLTSFSNPLFLLSDEGHPRLLYFMLEVMNSVIFYHLSDNPNLIYGILSSNKLFEQLGTFTLSRGLREIRRAQQGKEDQAQRKDPADRRVSHRQSNDERPPHEEKKRLLSNEENQEEGIISLEEQRGRSDIERPIAEAVDVGSEDSGPSEKAKGKMKERRSSSASSSLERLAAQGVGRNGFVPTQEWVTSWHQGLPLDTVMLVISELLPKIQNMQASHKTNSASAIYDFLSEVDLKDVLPPTPPLNPRRFMWSDASVIWLTSLIWGEVFVRGMTPLDPAASDYGNCVERCGRYFGKDELGWVVIAGTDVTRIIFISNKSYVQQPPINFLPSTPKMMGPRTMDSRSSITHQLNNHYEISEQRPATPPTRPTHIPAPTSFTKGNKSPIRQSFRNLVGLIKKAQARVKRPDNSSQASPRIPAKETKPSSSKSSGNLIYLARPTNSHLLPVWTSCTATLNGDKFSVSWSTAKNNPDSFSVDLKRCTDVRSLSSSQLSPEEVSQLPSSEDSQELKVFEVVMIDKSREKFAASSNHERATWVSAIWDVVLLLQDARSVQRAQPIKAQTEVSDQPINQSQYVPKSEDRDLPAIPSTSSTRDDLSHQPLDHPGRPRSPMRQNLYCSADGSTSRHTSTTLTIQAKPMQHTSSPSITNLSQRSMVKQRLAQMERHRDPSTSSTFPSLIPSRYPQENISTRAEIAESTTSDSIVDSYAEASSMPAQGYHHVRATDTAARQTSSMQVIQEDAREHHFHDQSLHIQLTALQQDVQALNRNLASFITQPPGAVESRNICESLAMIGKRVEDSGYRVALVNDNLEKMSERIATFALSLPPDTILQSMENVQNTLFLEISAVNRKMDDVFRQMPMSAPNENQIPKDEDQMAKILALLAEESNQRALHGQQQSDSVRYLNELNSWLETFVKNGISQIQAMGVTVQQLSDVMALKVDNKEISPVRLVHQFMEWMVQYRQEQENLLRALTAGNVPIDVLNVLHSLTSQGLSSEIKGERLRFVEAMKEATAINVQNHVEEFKKHLRHEVKGMTQEVSRLYREKQTLENQIADLLDFKRKAGHGGMVVAAAQSTRHMQQQQYMNYSPSHPNLRRQ